MKRPHLSAALAMLALLLVALVAALLYARWLESRFVNAMAPWDLAQKNQGSALQAAAFRKGDLLPIYGSSELTYDDAYHANRFFMKYPTGFDVFPVGMADTEPLVMAQKFAALGPELRGKKVVISLSPSFYTQGSYHPETYRGNFSPLHANALAFSVQLSFATKGVVARRMLEFPDTLDRDPVLKFALERLADGSPASLAAYLAAWPLGELHLLVLSLQDHWEVESIIWKTPELQDDLARDPRQIDWVKVAAQAEEEYKVHASNNSFGMENGEFKYYRKQIESSKNTMTDQKFLDLVNRSKGWDDLDLLLTTLNELGAEPLVLLLPMNGGYFDYQGISADARAVLYNRVREVASAHHVAAAVMDDHDEDKYFLIDPGAHMSSKGWVFYNRILDDFYHGRLSTISK